MQLISFPLSPHCRSVRLLLQLKKIDFTHIIQVKDSDHPWENPKGHLPVLTINKQYYFGIWSILLTLESLYPTPPYLENNIQKNAQIYSILQWILTDFYWDVYKPLFDEKVLKVLRKDSPDSSVLNHAFKKLFIHLTLMDHILESNSYLGAHVETLADVTAAATLSSIDYLHPINFKNVPALKEWYLRWKSRPAFAPLLQDRIPNVPPTHTYDKLDV